MDLIEGKRIIDYIIDQAERYDGQNLKIEHDILHEIEHLYDNMTKRVMQITEIYGDISTTLKYQQLINKIEVVVNQFYSEAYKVLVPAVEKYMNKGYSDFDDLIAMGHELEDKIEKAKVTEISGKTVDPNAINFMRQHAFEYVTNITNGIMTELRTQLGSMLASGNHDPRAVSEKVREIMDAKKSRADMIAQTELSMAYNNGALQRMDEFNQISEEKMRKYWHGFKFSQITCTYCRPRIGNIYDVNDNSEVLPAHPRCRCVWLPMMDGWDQPIPKFVTRNARMLNRVYSPEQVYQRINKRLGINYADYLSPEEAQRFITGDRTSSMMDVIANARDRAIEDTRNAFELASIDMEKAMAKEYKVQISFWKRYLAENIVDNNIDNLDKAYDAIKGVMILPWNGEQLKNWNDLLDQIRRHL